jgi:hypothetical protein
VGLLRTCSAWDGAGAAGDPARWLDFEFLLGLELGESLLDLDAMECQDVLQPSADLGRENADLK